MHGTHMISLLGLGALVAVPFLLSCDKKKDPLENHHLRDHLTIPLGIVDSQNRLRPNTF